MATVAPGPGSSQAGPAGQGDGGQGTASPLPKPIRPIKPKAPSFPGVSEFGFDGPLRDLMAEEAGGEGGNPAALPKTPSDTRSPLSRRDTAEQSPDPADNSSDSGPNPNSPQDLPSTGPIKLAGTEFRDRAHLEASLKSLLGRVRVAGGVNGLKTIASLGGYDGIQAILQENARMRSELEGRGGQGGNHGGQQGRGQQSAKPTQSPAFDASDPSSVVATYDWDLFDHLASQPKDGHKLALNHMMTHIAQYIKSAMEGVNPKADLEAIREKLSVLDQGPLADVAQTQADHQATVFYATTLTKHANQKRPDGSPMFPEFGENGDGAPPEFWSEMGRRLSEYGPEQSLTPHAFRAVYRDIRADMADGVISFGDWDPNSTPSQVQPGAQPGTTTRPVAAPKGARQNPPMSDVLDGGSVGGPKPVARAKNPQADLVAALRNVPKPDPEFGILP